VCGADILAIGLGNRKSCKQKFKEHKILTVTLLYILEVLCFIKKYKGSLKQNFAIHEYNTRSKYDLHTQLCSTSQFKKSVINMGIKPPEIKKLENFNCFRKKVKSTLLNKALYTLEEFLTTKLV
jgi:hypothetical protein